MEIRKKKTYEKIGFILGIISYIPVFLYNIIINGAASYKASIILLIVTQILWLASITLCTTNLEIENEILKKQIEDMKY